MHQNGLYKKKKNPKQSIQKHSLGSSKIKAVKKSKWKKLHRWVKKEIFDKKPVKMQQNVETLNVWEKYSVTSYSFALMKVWHLPSYWMRLARQIV